MKKTLAQRIKEFDGYSLYTAYELLDEIGREKIEWLCKFNELDIAKIDCLRIRVKSHQGHNAPDDEIATLDKLIEILKKEDEIGQEKTQKITLTTSEIINAIDSDEMTVDEILECVIRTPMTRTEIWNAAVYLFDGGRMSTDISSIIERYADHYGITLTWDEKIGIHDDLIALEVEHEEEVWL